MKCLICQSSTKLLFSKKILSKYEVAYYQCTQCEFVQTESPYWLDEAYTDAISNLDTGILERNIKLQKAVPILIKWHYSSKGKFIDYGAGYGLFVRLMRDKGFDYYWNDQYCTNLFAKKFDSSLQPNQSYELLTAFEVFEHLSDPLAEIEKMLRYSDSILFSTVLVDGHQTDPNWWYWSEETGQHVAFYSKKSIETIAARYGLHYYTNGFNFHLLTKKKIVPILFWALGLLKRIHSLIPADGGAKHDREGYKA